MPKPRILIQFDPDEHASVFDSIVAIDASVDHLLVQSNVSPQHVQSLVHGAMFTRGPNELKNTALFFGGSDVERSETLVAKAKEAFFGATRVSLMSDPNGCNTTAAAAVLSAQRHIDLAGKTITVLAGTGPVGQRIAQLIAGPAIEGLATPTIRICSRSLEKAKQIIERLQAAVPGETNFVPVQAGSAEESNSVISGADIVFAAGAAGVQLLPKGWTRNDQSPAVAIDLNAVSPAGIHGVKVTDKAERRRDTICYGAIGVGGFKMKIHKQCIQQLYESNDQTFELEEIYAMGRQLSGS